MIRKIFSCMKTENFINIITICLCSAGLLYQLSQISDRYFRFKTRSEVALSVHNAISAPQVSTCWFVKEMMPKIQSMTKDEYYHIVDSMSIQDMFENLPREDEILREKEGCSVRFPHQLAARKPFPDRIDCMKIFNVSKYIHRDLICYKFTISNIDYNDKLTITEYSLSPTQSGLIFRLWMNSTVFENVSYSATYVHSLTTSDLHDSMFARTQLYHRGVTLDGSNIMIDVTSSAVTIKKLEVPYDTLCRSSSPYPSMEAIMFEKMNQETISKLNRITTFYPILDQKINYRMVHAQILRNDTFLNQFMKIYQKYNVSNPNCYIHYYVSKVSISFGPVVSVAVFWPQDSRVKMEYIPAYYLIDYLLYVCSSFGIWLGVSILSVGQMIRTIIDYHFGREKTRRKSKDVTIVQNPNYIILQKRLMRRMDSRFIALFEYMKLRLELMQSRRRGKT